jgi:hypothetical protein
MEFHFDLQELFGTFTVGILFLVSFIYLYFLLMIFWRLVFKLNLNLTYNFLDFIYNFFRLKIDQFRLLSLASIIIIFTTGEIIQINTGQYSDSRKNKQDFLPSIAYTMDFFDDFKSNDLMRFDILFQGFDSISSGYYFTVTPLGHEIFSHPKIVDFITESRKNDPSNYIRYISFLKRKILSTQEFSKVYVSKIDSTSLRFLFDDCSKVYYLAKNWAYSKSNYFNELEKIKSRADFLRSCVLLTSWVVVIILFLSICMLLPYFNRFNLKSLQITQLVFRLLAFPLLYFLIFISSMTGFKLSSDNYNKRIFGYFNSEYDLRNVGIHSANESNHQLEN